MATLDLKDPDSGEEFRLFQVQMSEDTTQGSVDTFSAPGQTSDEAFISVLSEQETFSLTGLVTAPGLSGTTTPNAYSSDWRTALAEYAQRGEAFAHSAQNTGYTLEDRSRSRTSLNVCIESFSWTYARGAINELSYELTLKRGEGLLPDDPISIGSATPGGVTTQPTLGGETLHGFERLELEKSMGELNVVERAFASDAGENDITADQGTTRTWTFRGRYPTGKTPDQDTFDDNIRALIDDNTKTFATVFPGYSPSVKVLNFRSPREWKDGGESHEYEITVREAGN